MRILSLPELKTEKGIPFSRAHLDRLIKAKRFPAPIKIGVHRNGWVEAEIDTFLESLAKARNSQAEAA